jgi:3-oxoacyl-(acyl-carrier-protein) synthase
MNGLDLVVTGCGLVEPPGLDARLAGRLNANQARRLDRLSQMLLVAARDAAEEAGLPAGGDARGAVVVGTGLGCLEKTDDFVGGLARAGVAHADALTFPDSVDNAPAAHLATAQGLRGPALTVSQREISGEAAIHLAALLLRRGLADRVVAAAGEVASPRWRAALALLAPGRTPGEGAAAIVLETAAGAALRGATPRARLLAVAQVAGPVPGGRLRSAPATLRQRAEAEVLCLAGVAGHGDPGGAADLAAAPADRPYMMADGVLRSVDAISRMSSADDRPVLVSRAARGGLAAALLFGPPLQATAPVSGRPARAPEGSR